MTSTTMREVIELMQHRAGYHARWELYSILIDTIPSVTERFECKWVDRAYDDLLKRNHPIQAKYELDDRSDWDDDEDWDEDYD